nr:immunoglobulin heavy chain junction region [Mus musculus]MBK4195093.1 immunoglobulin heavy chain junction region [Mus musculus]
CARELWGYAMDYW